MTYRLKAGQTVPALQSILDQHRRPDEDDNDTLRRLLDMIGCLEILDSKVARIAMGEDVEEVALSKECSSTTAIEKQTPPQSGD